jgi:hypothetical protein
MLLSVLLVSGLPGCGASAARADAGAAPLRAQAAQAEATREHARLVELELRLIEMERRLANQARPCEGAPDPARAGTESSRPQPKPKPLRSQGDFQAEARIPPKVADAQPAPPTERKRLEELIEGLREYGFDPQSGLSLERREALRVLLRRERQLDLMNPWDER